MSGRYTGDGRRRSSMAHANHAYHFSCGKVVSGNAWVMHQRAHGCERITREQWIARYFENAQ